MITCDFSKRNGASLCEFLYSRIKEQILDGSLEPDERLPSKRSLAQHLGVSVITVQNAYENLISEGYIYSIEKKGFFVENLGAERIRREPAGKIGAREKKVSCPEKEFIADFTLNATSSEKFPFTTWAKVSRKILVMHGETLLVRQPSQGTEILRREIARHLKNFRNMDVDCSQIVIGAGTEILYSFVVQLFGMSKKYAVENPGYKKISQVFKSLGAKCVPVALDSDGIEISSLRKSRADAVHVTPSHHFPTGIAMPARRRFELLNWAYEKDGRFIIEDDYDSEFRFSGRPIEPLQSMDKKGRVIYMNTFSKTLSPSFRISFMVLPPNLLRIFHEKLGFYSCTVSAIEQFTLAKFIEEEHFSKHIIRMKNYYRSIRNNFAMAIEKSSLAKKVEITEKDSGLHFLLKVNSRKTGRQLKSILRRNGINAALLSDYYYDGACAEENTFVINYSGISREKISDIVSRMECLVK